MYRATTLSERRRWGTPHRIIGSSWYRSSNTACTYPSLALLLPTPDWRTEVRRRKAAHLVALAGPQRFPLFGDADNARELVGTPLPPAIAERAVLIPASLGTTQETRIAIIEARYRDWLDQRQREREIIMARRPRGAETPLEDILIDKGFVTNRYLLEINRSLTAPLDTRQRFPWNLPSRLMEYPLEVQTDAEGVTRIGLMHPSLRHHPFVRRVALAIKPHTIGEWGAKNASGHSQAPQTWWHAVDLIGKHWDDLLRSRDFTSSPDIIRAVVFALGRLEPAVADRLFDTTVARRVLHAAGSVPPADIVSTVLMLAPPTIVETERKTTHWPINSSVRDETGALAWLRVWGIEAGWFRYERGGFLAWSDHGRAMFHAVEALAATPELRQKHFGDLAA